MEDIFIVVPTLNPNIELLEDFLGNLQKEFKNVLIINDGCNEEYDNYFKSLEKKKIEVIKHCVNLGKGRALKDAFNYLLNKYPKLKGIVTADSDGQHSVEDIKSVAKKVISNPDDLILGVRDFDLNNVPKKSRFGNKTTRNVFKLFVGLNITDTQTGLRGLSKKLMIEFIDIPGERFEYETNQLISTVKKDIKIVEVPIETIYLSGNSESHFNPIKDSFEIYKVFLKYVFSSASAFIIDIVLFALFHKAFGFANGILFATIAARLISSLYNYMVNSKVVFKNRSIASLLKYYVLVVIQMLISGLVVQLFDPLIPISTTLIKIVVDIIIFIVNFVIQREIVFRESKNEKK